MSSNRDQCLLCTSDCMPITWLKSMHKWWWWDGKKQSWQSGAFFHNWVWTQSCTTKKVAITDHQKWNRPWRDLSASQPFGCCSHAVTLCFQSNNNRIQQTTRFKAFQLCKLNKDGLLHPPPPDLAAGFHFKVVLLWSSWCFYWQKHKV